MVVRSIALLLVLGIFRISTSAAFVVNSDNVIVSSLINQRSSRSSRSKQLRLEESSDESNRENSNFEEGRAGVDSSHRRMFLATSGSVMMMMNTCISPAIAADDSLYRAKRPTAYRIDSTIPPTMIPLVNARQQIARLKELGQGSGTDKESLVIDTINLNNILNKAVFGTADYLRRLTVKNESRNGEGYASFVCLGLPSQPKAADVELCTSLLSTIRDGSRSKNADMAIGVAGLPLSTQPLLDTFLKDGDMTSLKSGILKIAANAISEDSFLSYYQPIMEWARKNTIPLLALYPETEDIEKARFQGLQNIDSDRRSYYVADPEGFIGLTKDPRYQLYTDRSLLKDYEPIGEEKEDAPGGFFSERILVHETAATAAARYASDKPDALVAIVAPTPDLRFLNGINGRIPRIAQSLGCSKVDDSAITSILLNPTAEETLSKTPHLRLEIGTGPDTVDNQLKVADYVWFSDMPKVNLLTRLMDY